VFDKDITDYIKTSSAFDSSITQFEYIFTDNSKLAASNNINPNIMDVGS